LKEVEATFKVITPMFMAGQNQQEAEFRIPSLLGVLRFWYRATAPQQSIADLRKAEAELFGSTNRQSSILISCIQENVQKVTGKKHNWGQSPGIGYLGYGPITYSKKDSGNFVRSHLKEGGFLKINFLFRPKGNQDVEGLKRTIKALGLFGGLGSRSRRGFGSVTLVSLKDELGNNYWQPPRSREELQSEISSFIASLELNARALEPSYTAFSPRSRVVISETYQSCFEVLENIGREMIRYRSYGRGEEHKLPWSEKAEKNFSFDHDLLLSFGKTDINSHPRRVAFGLPHNYRFSNGLKVNTKGSKRERRASPLFIHIHELGREYVAVISYLPALFLPHNEKILISGSGKRVEVPVNIDNSVVTDFLDRIPGALEVNF